MTAPKAMDLFEQFYPTSQWKFTVNAMEALISKNNNVSME